jgi:hypothetical protein
MLRPPSPSRIILASIIASLAVLLLPVGLAIAGITSPELIGIEQGDDAPVRGAVFVLSVCVPFVYPFLVITMALIGFTLSTYQLLTRKTLFLISGGASIAVGLLSAFSSPFGLEDQIMTFLIFSSHTMLCLSLGVFVW